MPKLIAYKLGNKCCRIFTSSILNIVLFTFIAFFGTKRADNIIAVPCTHSMMFFNEHGMNVLAGELYGIIYVWP
jgi:hypothetical protein